MNEKILIVEDDKNIAKLLAMNLGLAGYETQTIADGGEAYNFGEFQKFDLILLDVMLPGADGFSIMEKIRPSNVPVIFLTAKSGLSDRVRGLRLGADDYILKPFEPIELLARVEAVLRRLGRGQECIKISRLEINLKKREIKTDGRAASLTPKEYELFAVLLQNKNIALSREQLLDKVWGMDYYGETRTVDMHITSLRKKLNCADMIKTVYKYGYRLEG